MRVFRRQLNCAASAINTFDGTEVHTFYLSQCGSGLSFRKFPEFDPAIDPSRAPSSALVWPGLILAGGGLLALARRRKANAAAA